MRMILLAFGLLALSSCGGDGSESGADLTGGEACMDVSVAACMRLQTCGLLGTTTVDTCESQFVDSCCATAGTCNNITTATMSAVDACNSALASWDCSSLEAQTLPTACDAL